MDLKRVEIGRCSLALSAAALAVALAGILSSMEGPASGMTAAAQPVELAQADSNSRGEAEAESGNTAEPEFTEEVLTNPEMVAIGEEIWQQHCRLCHGSSAYPGKGPNLRPRRYTPEFVYHRVTFGFGQMPAWEDVFSQEERVAVTAYVLSDEFSP